MTTAVATSIRITREVWKDFWRDGQEAIYTHWKEIASYPDIPLAPDDARYQQFEDAGLLRIFVARADDRLVGYAIFIVNTNAHYRHSLQAIQDVIFVEPAYRRGRTGLRLIQQSERALRNEGVQVVFHHVKQSHPALGRLLAHCGYDPLEVIMAKRLDRG